MFHCLKTNELHHHCLTKPMFPRDNLSRNSRRPTKRISCKITPCSDFSSPTLRHHTRVARRTGTHLFCDDLRWSMHVVVPVHTNLSYTTKRGWREQRGCFVGCRVHACVRLIALFSTPQFSMDSSLSTCALRWGVWYTILEYIAHFWG